MIYKQKCHKIDLNQVFEKDEITTNYEEKVLADVYQVEILMELLQRQQRNKNQFTFLPA
jgi:hypothetical protein